jgi:hypothetical protein
VPGQIVGPIFCSWILTLAQDYAWSSAARSQFLTDTNTPPLKGNPDCRPLTGPVLLSQMWNQWYDNSLWGLLNTLGAAPTNTNGASLSAFYPSQTATYQIYPGGPVYNIPQLPQSCANASWAPDPVKNPFGILLSTGPLSLNQNVTIQGTVIGANDIHVYGTGVQLTPFNLPALWNTTLPIRLPVAIAQNGFRIHPGAGGKIQGLLTAGSDFEIYSDYQNNIQVTLPLQIVCLNFLFYGRNEWNLSSTAWNSAFNSFNSQTGRNKIPQFPTYLQQTQGLNPQPVITIAPDPTVVHYHWNNLQTTIFAADYTADPVNGQLRWDVVNWKSKL